jgi:hypothetical protein
VSSQDAVELALVSTKDWSFISVTRLQACTNLIVFHPISHRTAKCIQYLTTQTPKCGRLNGLPFGCE